MIHRLIFENVQPAVDLLTKISSERRCISCYSCELPLVTMQQAISFNILILCMEEKGMHRNHLMQLRNAIKTFHLANEIYLLPA